MSRSRNKDRKLALEALHWINSLELPPAPNVQKYSFFDESSRRAISEQDHDEYVLQYRNVILRRGCLRLIQGTKQRKQARVRCSARECIVVDGRRSMVLRSSIRQWRWFVAHCYLSNAAVDYIEQKYQDKMTYRYKLHAVLAYWRLRAKQRKRQKSLAFAVWRKGCTGHKLVFTMVKFVNKQMLMDAYRRWKRRSKWPLVQVQRAIWTSKQAMNACRTFVTRCRQQRQFNAQAQRQYLQHHWPALRRAIRNTSRAHKRLQMAAAMWAARTVAEVLRHWQRWAATATQLTAKAQQAEYSTRLRILHDSTFFWQQYALGRGRQSEQMHDAKRLWKATCWRRLREHIHQQRTATESATAITSITRALSSSPTKSGRPRWVLFRGQLFRRRHALVRLWRHNLRVARQQCTAMVWGVRWWKRKAFRALRERCRLYRNAALFQCYASLRCKTRQQRNALLLWRQHTALRLSSTRIALYCLRRKYVRRWVEWMLRTETHHYKRHRASLRAAVNSQLRALRHWHTIAQRDRHCRHSLNVFRKLHPVPKISMIRAVFHAWRYEYAVFRREQKKIFRAAVAIRKHYHKQRYLQLWYDHYERCQVRRVQLHRAFGRLYEKYLRCKKRICELSNALILHKMAQPRLHRGVGLSRWVEFLVDKGLMLRTSLQLRSFYQLCSLRRWFVTLYTCCTHSRRQAFWYRSLRERVVQQCSDRFAALYHVQNKHIKWMQWRALRAWFQLQQRRLQCVRTLSLRIEGRQYFYRWVELYNRMVINRTLRVPCAPVLVEPHSRVVQSSIHHSGGKGRTSGGDKGEKENHTNLSYSRDYSMYTAGDRDITTTTEAAHRQEMPSLALDASVQLLQYHPAHIRKRESSRLKALSLSTIHCTSADQSELSLASSVLPRADRHHKPRKIIELKSTARTSQTNNSTLSPPSASPTVGYGARHSGQIRSTTPSGQKHSSRKTITTTSSAQGRSPAPAPALPASQRSIETPCKLWGQLIEEDCIDAARRSYSGQYLLAVNKLPVAL